MNKCAIYRTTNFIGKRWTLLILLELYKGKHETKRYSELKKSLPDITPKILSLRLKELEKENLIRKTIDNSQIPIKCEYFLTESGKDFIKIIKGIKDWSLKWNKGNNSCKYSECKSCSVTD